jgi:hypothetical protein
LFYAQKDDRTDRHYYGCGCRARKGKSACSNGQTIPEDEFLDSVKGIFDLIFEDADNTIKRILQKVESTNLDSRRQGEAVKHQIADQEKIIAGLQRLFVDPDLAVNSDTKRSVIRQCGEAEANWDQLRDSLIHLGDKTSDSHLSILNDAKDVFTEARACFSSVGSASMIHRFIEDFVGPIVVEADGRLLPGLPEKQTAPDDAGAALTGNVAATGLEPVTRGL